ncbi:MULTISPECIES: aminopeptidase [Comamonas]|uniref:aminopeptidase n=1 Tax=Comamonas TaxID=283 RepID=UPI00050E8036|nr:MULTISPECIES: aminopeptidase [Comamonas]KGG91362.1 aminopeptidase [Comamonas thiooxydans]KGG96975.1 aminopeptidase [Comamonas thiooxydans]KGH05496.1 aminopeptidase [Comamonas thiooxydans]KGH13362.1 aminopeptidase [Comamonas thiooxydans]TZG11507.1 aminopeptidase [Comamonas thiooxydans]
MSVVSLRALLGISAAIAGLTGCSSAGYYWQGFKGQMQILQAARPIDDWLAEDSTSAALRQRLQTAQQMRRFASRELALPDNASYTRYAQLQRPFAVWNVVAAPAYSLEMHQWCFPVTGCIAYRGYFSKSDAQAQALTLQSQGLETSVYGVPAYSTLGYLNWLGGDPLLSTFTSWQEGDFAGLLFHELAHQLLYVKNDTAFNESFATTVERMATPLWLHSHASAATQQRWQQSLQRRELWQQLTRETRQRLQQIYEQKNTEALDAKALEAIKSKVFDEFRATYAQLRAQWIATDEPLLSSLALREQYYRRLTQTDEWVAQSNNASFGALAAYDDWVPAMTRWWLQLRGEGPATPETWRSFYAQMRELAALSAEERKLRLCTQWGEAAKTATQCQ